MAADKNLHICNQCGKNFKYESEKRRHEKSHSPQFQCNICSKNFSYISALRRHVKQHERASTVTCNECRKDFRDDLLLKRHRKYAHAGSFTCTKCDTIFKSGTALRTHMQTHKPDSEKRYTCSYEGCTKKFNFRHHLKHHELTHSNTKQHYCKICGKGFIQLHHLKSHERTHNISSTLNCTYPECNKTFATEYAKKRHVAKYHIKNENVLSPDSNSAGDNSYVLKNSTTYFDPNMCPFAELKKANEIDEDLVKSNINYRENEKDCTNNGEVTNWKLPISRCIMKDDKEKCLCAQINKTLSNYDVKQFENDINFNTLSISSNDNEMKECCGGNCHKENESIKDEIPEIEYKVDGTIKIKEFLDIGVVEQETDKVIDWNKNNEPNEVIERNQAYEIKEYIRNVTDKIFERNNNNENKVIDRNKDYVMKDYIRNERDKVIEDRNKNNKIEVFGNETVKIIDRNKDYEIEDYIRNETDNIIDNKIKGFANETVKFIDRNKVYEIRNEMDKIIVKKNDNENKCIPLNSCKSLLGNCIVSGNGTIGEGCLCAKMALDDEVLVQEIEDITPHLKEDLQFI